MQKAILFIDSECVLCDGLSRYVAAIDTRDKLRIAPLGGHTHTLIAHTSPDTETFSHVELFWNNTMFKGPKAVFNLVKILGFPYSFLLIFNILPERFLWKLYNWVAENRYRWFGKKDGCSIGSPKFHKKLLP
ncbi:MAG: thiol-disulfide oxidoreductase DCC family protein [Thermaurantimonas sp.]